MWGESRLAKMVCAQALSSCGLSLAPGFVNNDYVTAEIIYSSVHRRHEGLTWSRVLCVYGYVSSTHKVAGIPAVSWLCPLGPSGEEEIQCPLLGLLRQPGERLCCVRLSYGCCQKRINVSAVPKAPRVSLQPLSWHLAYPGFSEQSEQCEEQDD